MGKDPAETGKQRKKRKKADSENRPSVLKGLISRIRGWNRWAVYLGTVAAAALSVVHAQMEILPYAAGIAVYIAAALLLTLSCIRIGQDLRSGIVDEILAVLKKNPFGQRFFDDYGFRTVLTTMPSFVINVAYTVYNGVIGVMNQSAWFITMAVYYSLLGVMRYRAVSTERKNSRLKDKELIRRRELSVIRIDGILLIILNLALSGVILLTIAKGTARTYTEIIVISIAAYTFYKIITAVINMIKVRKMQSPILITIRNIGVADALVSVLTLQSTMLASFQDRGNIDANRMNAITGLAVCVLITVLGISMICYGRGKSKGTLTKTPQKNKM